MKVIIRDGQSFESSMRKFKKKINDSGLLDEIRERQSYENQLSQEK